MTYGPIGRPEALRVIARSRAASPRRIISSSQSERSWSSSRTGRPAASERACSRDAWSAISASRPWTSGSWGATSASMRGDPDGLGAEVGPGPVVARGGGVPLVEDQVEHAHDVVQPLLSLPADGQLDRLALEGLLRPRDALPDGRVLGQERAGDLGDGQAADEPEGERSSALRRERRVAGEEDQPQHVVVDVVDERIEIGHVHLLTFQGLAELRRTTAQGVGAPERVDGTPLGGLHQPGRGVVGDAVARPLLEGRDQGVLGEILGQRQVAGQPRQRADEPGRLVAPHPLDGVLRVLRGPGLTHTRRLGPPCDVTIRSAPRPARRSGGSPPHPPSPASAEGGGRPSPGPRRAPLPRCRTS